jgi:hypothetical protein
MELEQHPLTGPDAELEMKKKKKVRETNRLQARKEKNLLFARFLLQRLIINDWFWSRL